MYIHTDMYLHVKYPIQQLAMFRSTQRTRTALVLPEGRWVRQGVAAEATWPGTKANVGTNLWPHGEIHEKTHRDGVLLGLL